MVLYQSIHQFFEAQVEKTPNSRAIEFEEDSLTYQELNCYANQIANYLLALNVEADTLVGICMERSLDMIVAMLGILKAGGAYVPLDPAYPKERLNWMISDSKLSILFTQEKLVSRLPDHNAQIICLDTNRELISLESEINPICKTKKTDLAYVIYTSGSTGKPKGVMIEHQSLINFTLFAKGEYNIQKRDRILQFASISFDAAIEEIYPCLTSGAVLILRNDEMVISISTFLKRCNDLRITVLDLPTAYWHQLVLELASSNLIIPKSLRLVIIGGELVLPKRVEMWKNNIGMYPVLINTYGPTEATVVTTTYKLSNKCLAELPIGRPISGANTYVLNEYLQEVDVDSPGELYIGGINLARGYLNQPDVSAEKFISNPFSNESQDRLYKTGDLVCYLPDGNLKFLGRLDNQVKIRGFRIDPGEVEIALLQNSDLLDAVVIAQENNSDNKHLVAYVIPIKKGVITDIKLRNFLRGKLPAYMIPSIFVILSQFPLNSNGKVDRKSLPRENTLWQDGEQDIIPPKTPTEEMLVAIWKKILGIERVSINDNFFDLGGHSLLLTQLISQIRNSFSVELKLSDFFTSPVLHKVARTIEINLPEREFSEVNYYIDDSTSNEITLELEGILNPNIYFESNINQECFTDPKSILFTGGTGFTGPFLIHEILQQTSANIFFIDRSHNVELGKQRLKDKLSFYGLWNEDFKSRINPIVGDISKPLLGMSDQKFDDLSNHIDTIYHNAASVNFLYPYSALKAVNVLGTEEIVRFAGNIKLKALHFTSTLSVFSSSTYSDNNIIRESEILDYPNTLESGYAQSKWVAEKLITQAKERGLPITIYRPGNITGHIKNGICNTNDFIWRFIKTCIQIGIAPNLDTTIDMTPVDYISKAIVYLSLRKESFGNAFHLVNPRPIYWHTLINKIKSFGYSIDIISHNEWCYKMIEHVKNNSDSPLYPFLPSFSSEISFNHREPVYDCQNTFDGLVDSNIICHPVNTELLRSYFLYFKYSNFLTSPLIY